jgi:uncharacterized ubiquitin-like protein YukD
VNQFVNIELFYRQTPIALRVPTRVTQRRLEALLTQALATIAVRLPDHWHLEAKNKAVTIASDGTWHDYAIGDGDQFEVIEEQANADI